jgi:hypothetical protein
VQSLTQAGTTHPHSQPPHFIKTLPQSIANTRYHDRYLQYRYKSSIHTLAAVFPEKREKISHPLARGHSSRPHNIQISNPLKISLTTTIRHDGFRRLLLDLRASSGSSLRRGGEDLDD